MWKVFFDNIIFFYDSSIPLLSVIPTETPCSNNMPIISRLPTKAAWCCVLIISGEATNTNFIVFSLTQPMRKPTIYMYHAQEEHANHYISDMLF
jgi:hypothetical protein